MENKIQVVFITFIHQKQKVFLFRRIELTIPLTDILFLSLHLNRSESCFIFLVNIRDINPFVFTKYNERLFSSNRRDLMWNVL